jgi:aryl-alcohol dehydrogenase-like predicted oxidoreductase
MKYRRLGNSGLLVSPVALGTMTFGEPVNESDSINLVHAALDMGVNFIDSANSYEGYRRKIGSAGGWAEEIVGKAIRDRRDRAVVVTKAANVVGSGPNDRGLSRVHLMNQIEKSLKRLQSDYIDVMMCHWPDRFTPYHESLGALDDAIRQGKVRYAAVSNHSAAQICEALWTAERRNYYPIVSNQVKYNLLLRDIEQELVEFCGAYGVGLMVYQPLEGGLLTGKYKKGAEPAAGTRAADMPGWVAKLKDESVLDRIAKIEELANQAGKPLSQYAIAWVLRNPQVSTVVAGVTRQEQLEQNAAAAEWEFPADHEAKIDKICPGPVKGQDPVRDPPIGG